MNEEEERLMKAALRIQGIRVPEHEWIQHHQFHLTLLAIKNYGEDFSLKNATDIQAEIAKLYPPKGSDPAK